MTFRSSENARERALRALTREAAELPVPTLDWHRIETKVLGAAKTAPVVPRAATPRASAVRWAPSPPTWASSPWLMAVAAAAAAALIYGSPSGAIRVPVRSQDEAAAVTQQSRTDLSSLEVGDVAETGAHPVVYDKAGQFRFALAPNSRIEVVAIDAEGGSSGGTTVALARGSIHAEVKPRAEGEVFAVEVGRTRVAVHGTSFTVSREGDRVIVDVAHGSVAVGPAGHPGSTHGWLVVGPDRAAFSLDGAREAAWLGAEPLAASGAAEANVEPPFATVADAPVSRAKRAAVAMGPASARTGAAATSSKNDVTAGIDTGPRVTAAGQGSSVEVRDPTEQEHAEVSAILLQLETCYEKQASAFGVRFSVESSLKLTISPSGAIHEGVFAPPLSPTLMSCANKAVGAAHFPSSEATRQIQVPVHLSRTPR